MKAYITKYALSQGIFEVDAEASKDFPEMISWQRPNDYMASTSHGEGRDWHRTKESAVLKADQMRIAKIASLKRTIKKLEQLKFE